MKLQYSFQLPLLITFLLYVQASKYRYSDDYVSDDHNPIRHGSSHPGERFGYESGGSRYERDAGTTALFQDVSADVVTKTNQKRAVGAKALGAGGLLSNKGSDVVRGTKVIQSPLHSVDDVESLSPLSSTDSVKNEIPLNYPRQDESRLLRHLLTNYDKRVRPILDAKKNITIYVGITLTQIFDMDEKNQVMTTNVWLDQEWSDELLTWDPVDYGNITQIRIPCDEIWLPDIVLYNNADDFTARYMRSLALVDFEGKVFWPPPTKFRSTCQVDVAYFPFDDQKCLLKLGSWLHDGFSMDLQTRTSHVDMSGYVPNGEWKLLQRPALTRRDRYYPCCVEPFPEISVSLCIRRKTLYYMYNIVFPCMMMSTLTVLVFCLPPDSGEKIALGVTVLLAFSVFMLAIAEKMPETSESIPLIGIYLTSVMAITCVSVIMTVIVLNFFYRGPTLTHVPVWAQRYILGKKLPKIVAPSKSEYKSLKRAASTRRMLNPNENRIQRRNSALGANTYINHGNRGQSGKSTRSDHCFADTRSEMAASLRTLVRSRTERHPSRSRTTSTSAPTNQGGWLDTTTTDNNGSIPSRAGTAIGQNHIPNLHYIDQGPEDGVELDNLLLERRSSTKSNTSRRSSSLSRKESLPIVQVIPPSVNGDTSPCPYLDGPSLLDECLATPTPTGQNHRNERAGSKASNVRLSPNRNGDFHGRRRSNVSISRCSPYEIGEDAPECNGETSEQDLNRIITMMADKNRDEETINQILQDWKLLAQKVDYVLFWIFLFMTTISSALFIFVLPEYNYYYNNNCE